VVAWWQLLCNIIAAVCSTKWKWLQTQSTRHGSNGKGGSISGGMVATAVQHCHGRLQCKMEAAAKNQPEVAVVAKVAALVVAASVRHW